MCKSLNRIDAKLSSNPLVKELYDKARAQAKAQAEEQLKAFAQVNERIFLCCVSGSLVRPSPLFAPLADSPTLPSLTRPPLIRTPLVLWTPSWVSSRASLWRTLDPNWAIPVTRSWRSSEKPVGHHDCH